MFLQFPRGALDCHLVGDARQLLSIVSMQQQHGKVVMKLDDVNFNFKTTFAEVVGDVSVVSPWEALQSKALESMCILWDVGGRDVGSLEVELFGQRKAEAGDTRRILDCARATDGWVQSAVAATALLGRALDSLDDILSFLGCRDLRNASDALVRRLLRRYVDSDPDSVSTQLLYVVSGTKAPPPAEDDWRLRLHAAVGAAEACQDKMEAAGEVLKQLLSFLSPTTSFAGTLPQQIDHVHSFLADELGQERENLTARAPDPTKRVVYCLQAMVAPHSEANFVGVSNLYHDLYQDRPADHQDPIGDLHLCQGALELLPEFITEHLTSIWPAYFPRLPMPTSSMEACDALWKQFLPQEEKQPKTSLHLLYRLYLQMLDDMEAMKNKNTGYSADSLLSERLSNLVEARSTRFGTRQGQYKAGPDECMVTAIRMIADVAKDKGLL